MSANGGFQFTLPGRGATIRLVAVLPRLCVSIHAPREGCDKKPVGTPPNKAVSIHAPREGCDVAKMTLTEIAREVSIHAPREGCDAGVLVLLMHSTLFQFTHPGRGATE